MTFTPAFYNNEEVPARCTSITLCVRAAEVVIFTYVNVSDVPHLAPLFPGFVATRCSHLARAPWKMSWYT